MPGIPGAEWVDQGGGYDTSYMPGESAAPGPFTPPAVSQNWLNQQKGSGLATDWRVAGQNIALNPALEAQYQAALKLGIITREQMQQALIEKDRLLQRMRGGQPSWYSGRGWQGNASALAGLTPEQIALIAPDLQGWLNPTFSSSPFSPYQPTLQMNNTDWGSIPPQYRGGVDAYMRAQGLRPAGSLGQYDYNTWTPATPTFAFNPASVAAVSDPNLQAWINRLLLGKGWIASQ